MKQEIVILYIERVSTQCCFHPIHLYIGRSDVTYLWSQCDRHFVGQHVVGPTVCS